MGADTGTRLPFAVLLGAQGMRDDHGFCITSIGHVIIGCQPIGHERRKDCDRE